jgi:hypothetical protein
VFTYVFMASPSAELPHIVKASAKGAVVMQNAAWSPVVHSGSECSNFDHPDSNPASRQGSPSAQHTGRAACDKASFEEHPELANPASEVPGTAETSTTMDTAPGLAASSPCATPAPAPAQAAAPKSLLHSRLAAASPSKRAADAGSLAAKEAQVENAALRRSVDPSPSAAHRPWKSCAVGSDVVTHDAASIAEDGDDLQDTPLDSLPAPVRAGARHARCKTTGSPAVLSASAPNSQWARNGYRRLQPLGAARAQISTPCFSRQTAHRLCL